MIHHRLTDKGILQFRKDWQAAQAEGQDRAAVGAELARG